MARTDTAEDRLRLASRLLAEDQPERARAILDDLPPLRRWSDRAAHVRLHRELGTPRTDDEAQLAADLARPATTPDTSFERAKALCLLDHPDALEAAEIAVTTSGTARGPLMLLLRIYLDDDRPDAAAAAILRLTADMPRPGGLLLVAAKVLGQTGHRDQAITLLDAAEPHQQDNRAEFSFVSAGIRGEPPLPGAQSEMASAIFDKFAEDYDDVLASIRYSAPDMIAALLAEMALAPRKRLQVLDAGCGTGLCAKLLRPYAKALHGADISVPMLEKAKRRKVYHGLTRTDLNAPATIPAGPFDLIVLADVLIYFGDLSAVLGALAQRLTPGGWLLLTVEDGGALPPPGFVLGAAGRYKHAADHIRSALVAAGLGPPKHQLSETLRHEFGVPVHGLAVAAQKPMLAF